MKTTRVLGPAVFLLAQLLFQPLVAAAEKYYTPVNKLLEVKDILDDPEPFYTKCNYYKDFIPQQVWDQIVTDEQKSKEVWEQAVGLKAPDLVGKIAPEIKPGPYTLADKAKYPFKDLMIPVVYQMWNEPGTEGQPNHFGCFTEVEVIPTQQLWHGLPVAEATLKNMGQTKQDAQGYMVLDSYKAGFPFPRPSGDHMGLQLLYNWKKRKVAPDSSLQYDLTLGIDSRWNIDHRGIADYYWLRTQGRVQYPPLGWLDERAEKAQEEMIQTYIVLAPRDLYGNVYNITFYGDPHKESNFLAYVNLLRRVRKLSSSDRQDQAVGQDMCYDDADGFAQDLTPDRYPYEYKIIEEREFLFPAYTLEGKSWFDSKEKFKWKELKLERRPCWVVEMIQKDSNYIYSKRIAYFDKETLWPLYFAYYDQKGRLYRDVLYEWGFVKPLGYYNYFNVLNRDFIDVHSTFTRGLGYPALWLNRDDMSLREMMKAK
ncbi:MAG: DUF1329 domain-containing protein [bacterium]